MKFSLIVPFYNCEQYLSKCLDSLLAQTYLKKHRKDVEILLVDNNSTDNSIQIAKRFAKDNSDLIKLSSCKKWGAAAARNSAIRNAIGDYIWCIDSDDWIELNSLSCLANKISELEKKKIIPDVITISTVRDYDKGMEHLGKVELLSVGKGQKDWQNRFVMFGFGPCGYIARRDFILKNKLFFDEGIIHEDMALISSFVLYTQEIYAIPDILYHYVQHPKSVLHRSEWNPHALDIFPALEKLYSRFDAEGLKYADALEYFFIWNLLSDTVRNFKKYSEGRANIKRIRQMLHRYFPHWRQNPILKSKSLKRRIRFQLAYYFGI